MEDELRLFLLLGGTVFIIGVLAHGIWKIRKNSPPEEKTRLEPRQWDDQEDAYDDDDEQTSGFDELGLGAVRVVGKNTQNENAQSKNTHNEVTPLSGERPKTDHGFTTHELGDSDTFTSDTAPGLSSDTQPRDESADKHHQAGSDVSDTDVETNDGAVAKSADSTPPPVKAPEPKLYGSVVTNPKPHMKGTTGGSRDNASVSKAPLSDIPEPPGFLLKEGDAGVEERSQEGMSSDQQVPTTPASSPQYSAEEHTASRPQQKFYVDPTLEPEKESDLASAHPQPSPDFSLDAPQPAADVAAKDEGQSKRFSRSRRQKPASRKREEPNFGDDQMRIDFDTSEEMDGFSATHTQADGTESTSKHTPDQVEQEVLVLNVRAPEEAAISGAALLPMLLTLGFKFGDQDIFHRHVNSNGKGPVLFSLANMFKPGVFDIDNLENFETQGVSLFMILPIEGDPHQVFNMMHNAARKLADEFGAQVLDGRRSVLTKQGLQQYVEKIREFERKRMIARS